MAGSLKFDTWLNDDSTENYKCRAWVNFNGTGTVAIRASGNVSSITDNGTGAYAVNFTNAMLDANYAWVGSCKYPTATVTGLVSQNTNTVHSASSFGVITSNQNNQAAVDCPSVYLTVQR